jgi:hypothetical protein
MTKARDLANIVSAGSDLFAETDNNLSDLADAPTAITNLGLGTAATANVEDLTISWLLKSADYTASEGEKIAADVSASAWTLTLPTDPEAGFAIDIAVIDGDASVNNLTIDGNGTNVQGDTTLTIDLATSPLDISFIYNSTEWRIA